MMDRLINYSRGLFAALLLAVSPLTFAQTLDDQISIFLLQNYAQAPDSIQIRYTRNKPALSCEQPELSLMTPSRLWGNITLKAMCDAQRHFIPLTVEVTGKYVTAKRAIRAGEVITADDLQITIGRLDKLSTRVLMDANFAIGSIALRNFSANQPITDNMLRQNWVIKAGQQVDVVASGEGFQIKSQGKALTNGTLKKPLSVKMSNGNTVNGIVIDSKTVNLIL